VFPDETFFIFLLARSTWPNHERAEAVHRELRHHLLTRAGPDRPHRGCHRPRHRSLHHPLHYLRRLYQEEEASGEEIFHNGKNVFFLFKSLYSVCQGLCPS